MRTAAKNLPDYKFSESKFEISIRFCELQGSEQLIYGCRLLDPYSIETVKEAHAAFSLCPFSSKRNINGPKARQMSLK
jgi:hypothetical protein